MRKAITWDKIVFGITIYVFLSLNAKDLRPPAPELFRWILPMVLVFVAVIKREGRLALPPMLIILFVFALAPSFLDTPNFKDSLMKAISFIWIVYGTYICFWGCKDRTELVDFFKVVCLILLFFEALNIIYIVIGRGGGTGGRYDGFVTNPNTLSIYSNLSFWAAYYYYYKKNGWKKLLLGFFLIASVVLVIMSGSRTGFIMVLINIIIAVFLQARTTIAKILTVIAIVTVVVLLFTGNLRFLKIQALDRILETGGGSRGELWDYGLNVWKRFPIFGCGYRQSKVYNLLPGNVGYDFHNSYLSLLIEVGIWGAMVMLVAIVPVIYSSFNQCLKELKLSKNSGFAVVAFMALSLMVCAWSESFLFSVGSTEAFAFWMLFVWLMSYLKKGDKQWVEWQ